jgi:DNA-binding transcriptional ArsR family regulator
MNPTTFHALSEPHRLEIVELLRNQPLPVGEIVGKLRLNQPQVSKHLKVLADAGLVQVNPRAQQRIYALQPKPFSEIEIWIKKINHNWEDRFSRLDKILKQNRGDSI